MRNYLVFYGDVYYPYGGMNDFIGDYDDKDEAITALEERHKKTRPDDLIWEWSWGHVWSIEDEIEVFTK